ncbi:MAG: MFS transporter [Clostridia bacterium]|nr:MFS transporter [Clostridia bacterium]
MKAVMNEKVKNALFLGTLCSISYLAVYIARNILGAVTPQMQDGGIFTKEYIAEASSLYFIFYAVGQLINGAIGDKIKAKYMMCIGLFMAGVTNLLFSLLANTAQAAGTAQVVYALTGFFLSMIYGPMTKVVAENVEEKYVARCSLGYTFASFFGSPVAGVLAAVMTWQSVFAVSSGALFLMAVVGFVFFTVFEKKGIVKYNQYKIEETQKTGGGVKVLLKHQIVKFSLVSILTGVVRTSVVFWLTDYISDYLQFSSQSAAGMYSVATLGISASAFIAVFVYERLKQNMNKTLLLMFALSAVFFLGAFLIKQPIVNIIMMVLAIIAANCSATMLWSIYCPSLRDTGMVSGATGFLDFLSYMAAAVANVVFANAVADIGWGNLILIWCGLMVLGVIVALPYRTWREKWTKKE